MGKHWTEELFLDSAYLFGPSLEQKLDTTGPEVDGLVKIFSEHSIPSGRKILDLGCGVGRHSLLLAERGYKTLGVDISPDFIKRANELAVKMDVTSNVDFRVGDMRDVASVFDDNTGRVDVAVNLLTTHGYWDKETDIRIYRQARKLVKSNGLLIIHTANRDFLVKHFQVRDWSDIPNDRLLLMERQLNLEESRMYVTWNYYKREDDEMIHLKMIKMDHLVYSLHEFKGIIEEAGWQFQACYGGFDQRELTVDTFPMIIVANNLG